VIKYG